TILQCDRFKSSRPKPTPPPQRKECKGTLLGNEYTGTISYTHSGIPCQRWDSQTPQPHPPYDDTFFPDGTVYDASNFCRNPTNHITGPWCFTTDPYVRWQQCSIPYCECKTDPLGLTYKGQRSYTVGGK
ncbi:unnamed protein product, partial [Owenia fusiformis]